jgi:non-heme chloroperoxidase
MRSEVCGDPFEEMKLAGGPTLHCLRRGGRGERVLLLHGYGDSGHAWSTVLPHLPARWQVAAPDQRGHGGSERPDAGYTVASLATDAAKLLDALGWERATVVGHSMGGFVAQQLAVDRPERVARLVLVGTTPRCAGPAVDELMAEIAALSDDGLRDFVAAFQAATVARPLPPAFFAALVEQSCRVPVRVWRALAPELAAFDARSALSRIAAPAHVVWGDADAFFGRDEQETLLAALPRATFTVYRGAGHSPHWEDPERFARDLAAFVSAGDPD